MEKFKDADGREYSIDRLSWKQLRAMKCVGLTLETIGEGLDSTVAVDALLIATEGQRKRLLVDDDAFASAIFPEVGPALEALLREVLRFFRQPIPDALQPERSSPDEANSSTD